MTVATRRLDIDLTAPQSRAFQLIQQHTIDVNLEWGRGCGKSWFDRLCAWLWIARADGRSRLDLLREIGVHLDPEQASKAERVRGVRVVFLMPTLKQFKDVHGAALKNEVTEWAHLGPRPNWTEYSVAFPGGSWMAPFPAEQHSSQRSRGIRADIVIGDEADDIDSSVFDSIVRPWFSEPWSLKIRLTSGTYKRGRHGLLFRRREAGRDPSRPRYHSIHATYRDCPEIVDLAEVEDAKRDTLPATFAREWECDPDSAEGLVYPFDESFHVQAPPSDVSFREFIVGADHGWADPGVLLRIGIQGHGRDAVAWVLEEEYAQARPNHEWDQLAAKWRDAVIYADPSRPDRINDMRRVGCNVQPADNSVEAGVSRVADMLFRRQQEHGPDWCRLYVHPRCRNTIREFVTYRRKRDPHNAESFLETIEDRNNHAMDALRYALIMRFGRVGGQRFEAPGR
jgi:hypothetical protein